jgi:hypothetical protein
MIPKPQPLKCTGGIITIIIVTGITGTGIIATGATGKAGRASRCEKHLGRPAARACFLFEGERGNDRREKSC